MVVMLAVGSVGAPRSAYAYDIVFDPSVVAKIVEENIVAAAHWVVEQAQFAAKWIQDQLGIEREVAATGGVGAAVVTGQQLQTTIIGDLFKEKDNSDKIGRIADRIVELNERNSQLADDDTTVSNAAFRADAEIAAREFMDGAADQLLVYLKGRNESKKIDAGGSSGVGYRDVDRKRLGLNCGPSGATSSSTTPALPACEDDRLVNADANGPWTDWVMREPANIGQDYPSTVEEKLYMAALIFVDTQAPKRGKPTNPKGQDDYRRCLGRDSSLLPDIADYFAYFVQPDCSLDTDAGVCTAERELCEATQSALCPPAGGDFPGLTFYQVRHILEDCASDDGAKGVAKTFDNAPDHVVEYYKSCPKRGKEDKDEFDQARMRYQDALGKLITNGKECWWGVAEDRAKVGGASGSSPY